MGYFESHKKNLEQDLFFKREAIYRQKSTGIQSGSMLNTQAAIAWLTWNFSKAYGFIHWHHVMQ